MIYFAQAPDGGPIKIGVTARLCRRLAQLSSGIGKPLRILAVLDGSFAQERAIHSRFASLRTAGEWFRPGDDLLDYIAAEGKPWDGKDEAQRVSVGFDRPEEGDLADCYLSFEVLQDARISPAEKMILLALPRWDRGLGECCPSDAEIAEAAAIHRRTVQRGLDNLARLGFIREERDRTNRTGRRISLLRAAGPDH